MVISITDVVAPVPSANMATVANRQVDNRMIRMIASLGADKREPEGSVKRYALGEFWW